jgi:hypothetical protein
VLDHQVKEMQAVMVVMYQQTILAAVAVVRELLD